MQRNDQAADSFRQKEIWFHTTSNGVVELLAQGAVEASSITSFRRGTETSMRKNSFSVYWMQKLRKSLTDKSWEEAMPMGEWLCLSCFGVSLLMTCFRSLSETGSWGSWVHRLPLFRNFYVSTLQWSVRSLGGPICCTFSDKTSEKRQRMKNPDLSVCLFIYVSICLSTYQDNVCHSAMP